MNVKGVRCELADVTMEVGAGDQASRLMTRAAQDQTSAGKPHPGSQFFERAQTGRVQSYGLILFGGMAVIALVLVIVPQVRP